MSFDLALCLDRMPTTVWFVLGNPEASLANDVGLCHAYDT
jgi:hypothetical protein